MDLERDRSGEDDVKCYTYKGNLKIASIRKQSFFLNLKFLSTKFKFAINNAYGANFQI